MIMGTPAFKRVIKPEYNLKMLQTGRDTLPGHNQTGYAVWDAGACCQESDAHDDIRDSKSVANYSHLKGGCTEGRSSSKVWVISC